MVAMGEEAITGALIPTFALDPGATFIGTPGRVWSCGVWELDDEG